MENSHILLRNSLHKIAKLLPTQGPMDVFIHHNTLHALEDWDFETAAEYAYQETGGQPYLSLSEYQDFLQKDRIEKKFVHEIIREEESRFTPLSGFPFSHFDLASALLLRPVQKRDFRADKKLWKEIVHKTQLFGETLSEDDLILEKENHREKPYSFSQQEQFIIRLCKAYLDLGFASWQPIDKSKGFTGVVQHLLKSTPRLFSPRWLKNMRAQFQKHEREFPSPFERLHQQCVSLNIPENQWEHFLKQKIHALRGWAGMMKKLNLHEDDLYTLFYLVTLNENRHKPASVCKKNDQYIKAMLHRIQDDFFFLCQTFKIEAHTINNARIEDLKPLFSFLLRYSDIAKRRLWQRALDLTFRNQTLSSYLSLQKKNAQKPETHPFEPRAQFVFCLDERFESVRRHLESTSPHYETFGAAGFFALACELEEEGKKSKVLCPPILKPGFKVTQKSRSSHPHDLNLEIVNEAESKKLIVDGIVRLLQDIGLTKTQSRFVFVFGHGATTVNNPHASAYNCGACGGHWGNVNAKIFAHYLNQSNVRDQLRSQGFEIAEHTHFVGGFYDTSSENVTLFDTDSFKQDPEFKSIQADLLKTRELNALERCRRFASASLHWTPAQALRHVQKRAEHLGEPRPECGHATNAICYVGTRNKTEELYLDRRAFLVAYNPQSDTNGEILTRILRAIVPVCTGINLEYYFSRVDNQVYGCGTKLPHNVTGALGVMNGALDNLRTGLPWQMVELHEPVRLVMMLEAKPERIEAIMSQFADFAKMVLNRWIQLVAIDPENTCLLWVHEKNRFVPFDQGQGNINTSSFSRDVFKGKRDHLPFVHLQRIQRAS